MAPGTERVRGAYRVVKTLYWFNLKWCLVNSAQNQLGPILTWPKTNSAQLNNQLGPRYVPTRPKHGSCLFLYIFSISSPYLSFYLIFFFLSWIKPYLHGDILPGKLLKIEQASEKSSCKSGIFLCHIVRSCKTFDPTKLPRNKTGYLQKVSEKAPNDRFSAKYDFYHC